MTLLIIKKAADTIKYVVSAAFFIIDYFLDKNLNID